MCNESILFAGYFTAASILGPVIGGVSAGVIVLVILLITILINILLCFYKKRQSNAAFPRPVLPSVSVTVVTNTTYASAASNVAPQEQPFLTQLPVSDPCQQSAYPAPAIQSSPDPPLTYLTTSPLEASGYYSQPTGYCPANLEVEDGGEYEVANNLYSEVGAADEEEDYVLMQGSHAASPSPKPQLLLCLPPIASTAPPQLPPRS